MPRKDSLPRPLPSNPPSAVNVELQQSDSLARKPLTKVILALADQAFVSLNSFVTMMVVVKFCSTGDLNVYVLAWSILCFFRVIQERMLAAPYVVFAHQPERENPAFLGSSLVQQVWFSIVSSLIFIGLAILFNFVPGPEGLSVCFAVIAVVLPPILLRDHLRAVSCTHFRYGAAALLSGVALLLQFAIIYVCYLNSALTANAVFAAMGVASLLPALVWLMVKTEPFQFVKEQFGRDWQTCYRYSSWLVAARFFPSIVNSLLPFLVLYMVSEDASGIWGSCMTLANVSMMFVIGCNNLFQPKAVVALQTQGKTAMQNVLGLSAVVFSVVLTAVCLVYFFAGEYLLTLAFKPELAPFGNVVTILSLHVLICSLSIVAGNGLAAMEKSRGIFVGELFWSIVTLAAAALLTPEFGLAGTAVAICAGSMAATIIEGGWLMYWLKSETLTVGESIA